MPGTGVVMPSVETAAGHFGECPLRRERKGLRAGGREACSLRAEGEAGVGWAKGTVFTAEGTAREGPEVRSKMLANITGSQREVGHGVGGTWGGVRQSQPTGDRVGPGDTLHSILRAVGSAGGECSQGDDKVRFGFRTFWTGERTLFQTPTRQELCWS